MSWPSTTIERPSGVSSASEESCATSASSDSGTPGIGMNSDAWRFPRVIVPVLSSKSTSTSPEASTARPESASTLRRTRRSMPAMPIALNSAPIVVGISATSNAISVVSEIEVPANRPNGRSVATTIMKISVNAASRIPSATSFGVLRRSAPSTRAIMRSRNDLPGSWVISTTIRSEVTRVPPVTAERSPPDSRITGADSPVIADSSTVAMPSITLPSPGIKSPATTTTMSPRVSAEAAFIEPSRIVATVSLRMLRNVSACARPRPSANASAMLAKITVSHSQKAIVNVYQAGSWPPPSGLPPNAWISHVTVVITEPISTTNMTGLRTCTRGSSFLTLSISARLTISPWNSETAWRSWVALTADISFSFWATRRRSVLAAVSPRRHLGASRCDAIEGEVQFEHVHAFLAGEAQGAAGGVLGDQGVHPG